MFQCVRQLFCVMMLATVALGAMAQEGVIIKEGGSSMTGETVVLTTNKGVITIKLDADKAPVTVKNFLTYVNEGFYNGTIFHRVIPGFMIQGGGFGTDFVQKKTHDPILNEASNGLKNKKYTVAMARTSDPSSATAQFFINVKDNGFLDYTAPTPSGYGYAVFGEVVEGQDVVDAIAAVSTGNKNGYSDVPVESVIIEKAAVK